MSPELLTKLKPFLRNAWIPHTEEVAASHSAENKFCGLPYLRDANDWPRCKICNCHMQLFVQIDLSTLPEKKENGIAQFFYCTNNDVNCELKCESWAPNETCMHARLIHMNGASAIVTPELVNLFPEKRISAWECKEDYPNYEELYKLNAGLTDAQEEELIDAGFPIKDDKLFGWPKWVQGVEYHLENSELLVQITSEDNVPFMFGDCGTGHLTRKKDDSSVMAFGWACC